MSQQDIDCASCGHHRGFHSDGKRCSMCACRCYVEAGGRPSAPKGMTFPVDTGGSFTTGLNVRASYLHPRKVGP